MIRSIPLAILLLATVPNAFAQRSWDRIRSIAESQHEVLMLLIKNLEFDRILEESKRIFELKFPEEHQHLLVEEAMELSDALTHHKQHHIAVGVLDQCLEAVAAPALQARLYKEKAYLFKKLGDDKQAMECFKRSIALEKQASRP